MSFFKLAGQRMQWLGARQQVIAQNVANADTPNYKARDVTDFADVMRGAATGGLKVTNSKHIGGATSVAAGVSIREDEQTYEQSLDGNTVALEQQTIKATETAENYRLAAQLYRKGHELLTLAATGVR
jgi:flagellar basal-body rod protein FlgB